MKEINEKVDAKETETISIVDILLSIYGKITIIMSCHLQKSN